MVAESNYGAGDQAAAAAVVVPGSSFSSSSYHVGGNGAGQNRLSYLLAERSLSSSPPGEAEGGGPVPVIEFPDDEVFFFYLSLPFSILAPPFINPSLSLSAPDPKPKRKT